MAVTQFLGWPYDDDAGAQIYYDAIQEWWSSHYKEQFAAEWYPRLSTKDQWIVPYLGPPVETADGPLEEPEGMEKLRWNAEFVEPPIDWPEEC